MMHKNVREETTETDLTGQDFQTITAADYRTKQKQQQLQVPQ